MAKKFVNVKGLHNVFASETALANNTILNDVSTIIDQNSVLYITADTTDETTFPNYKIYNGDNVVYAKGKLVGNYLGNSLKSLTNTAATLSINDNYDVYFITNTYNGAVTLTFALSSIMANANKSLNIMAIIKNDNSTAITINLAADSNFNFVNNLYSSNSFLLGTGEVVEIYYNEIKNGNGIAYLSFGVNKSDETIDLINRIELNGTALQVNNSSVNIPLAAQNITGVVKTTSTTTSATGLIATPIISGVPYYKDTVYTHPGKTLTDTTSSATPTHGGTFSVVDSVTRDSSGHVSGINVKTVTLPASGNTDEKQKVTATTSGTFYLSGVGTTSNTPAVGVADATIKVVNRVLTATSASLTNATVSTITVSTINGISSPVFTDEKVKVSTSTTNASFPLMAIATSSVTSGNTYQVIYDHGININPYYCSIAEGSDTTADSYYAHAEGLSTLASGTASHAEGKSSKASGILSHAEGYNTTASGEASHAEGEETTASGNLSHAEGSGTLASGTASHAEGSGTLASGTASHAEGMLTTASGDYSHAEGEETTAFGHDSHAEGGGTTASGNFSHAEGMLTTASGTASHAEGGGTAAVGEAAHAEGASTTASGQASHAEGSNTIASGTCSHAGGYGTIANVLYAMSIGHFNSTCSAGDLFVIGNGSDSTSRRTVFQISSTTSGASATASVIVTGNVKASAGFFQESDKNIKNIVSDLDLKTAYNLLDKCQTIIYTLKDDPENNEQIGMIAQEVQEFFPEIISIDGNGILSLDYSKLSVIIFRILKDLIKRIEKLEEKLKD